MARRASLVGHVGLVVLASVGGCLAAFAAWLLTAYRIPLFADGQEVIARKPLPDWWIVVGPGVAAGLLLAVVAVVAAADLSRSVRRSEAAWNRRRVVRRTGGVVR